MRPSTPTVDRDTGLVIPACQGVADDAGLRGVRSARRTTVGGGGLDTLRASGVTRREADILSLLAAGLTNADIAEQLYLSVRTVESHVSSLLAKLGARNRTDLAARHLELQRREGR